MAKWPGYPTKYNNPHVKLFERRFLMSTSSSSSLLLTVAKTDTSPNMSKDMPGARMFSHFTMGGPERPAVATAAPHLHRFTTEVYHPS
jgi:hypothetical protein